MAKFSCELSAILSDRWFIKGWVDYCKSQGPNLLRRQLPASAVKREFNSTREFHSILYSTICVVKDGTSVGMRPLKNNDGWELQ